MLRQLWWVPPVLIYYGFYAWLSRQNNLYGGRWFAFMILCGMISLWTVVSYFSKNLVRDGLLYDSLMLFGHNLMLVHLGVAAEFGMRQWAGVALMIVGFYLLR